MAVNKVVYDGDTLIDLTSDTVTAETLAEGETAHDASGVSITGTLTAVQYGKAQSLTEAQKAQARENIGAVSEAFVLNELAERSQLKPEFANSIEECTDTNLLYVLPDGYIYAYMTGGTQEVFTDVLKDVGYTDDMRINSSGGIVGWTNTDADVTGYIPVKPGDIIRVKNMPIPSTYTSGAYWNKVASYDVNKAYISSTTLNIDYADTAGTLVAAEAEDGNIVKFTVVESVFGSNTAYIVINAKDITDESEVYVNSTTVSMSGFANTGLAFVPADYEDRIVYLEDATADHEARLKLLEANENGSRIPAYWLDELESKADAIQRVMETAGRNKSAFLWYTDAHWPNSAKVSPALLDYLTRNTPMNKINFGGDIVGDPASFTHDNIKYVYDWRKMIAGLLNHHSVAGNHDLNHNSTDVQSMAYAYLLAPEESPDMVMGGELYYYIDNPAEKTRYIYLDYMTSNHDEMVEQGQFVVDAIKGVTNGWHIVAIGHRWFQYTSASAPTVGSVPSYEAEMLSVFDAYNARTSRTASNYFGALDFAAATGKVEFCIGGHIHVDYDLVSTGGIPVILTASDTNQERSSDETEDSGMLGTTTEAAVYGIVADYTNGKINVIGVGRGGSREITI